MGNSRRGVTSRFHFARVRAETRLVIRAPFQDQDRVERNMAGWNDFVAEFGYEFLRVILSLSLSLLFRRTFRNVVTPRMMLRDEAPGIPIRPAGKCLAH